MIDQRGPGAPADPERIGALDGLRGFALCGILLMNLPLMGGSLHAGRPLAPVGDLTAPASIVWWVQQLLAEGAFRGLFSALFGAGIVLFMSRAEASGRPATWPMLRRLFWLFVFGGINASLLVWPAISCSPTPSPACSPCPSGAGPRGGCSPWRDCAWWS